MTLNNYQSQRTLQQHQHHQGSGRSFGNDITHRFVTSDNAAAKSMNAVNNKPVLEKRVTRSMSRADPAALKPKSSASAVTTSCSENSNGNVTTNTVAATTKESETVNTTTCTTTVATEIATKHIASLQIRVNKPKDPAPTSTDNKSKAPSLGYQYTGPVHDIDEADRDDPLKVAAYASDIYAMHRDREDNTFVKPTYMISQTHINETMRAILLDWFISVQIKFDLVPQTLYLTVNLLDRILECAKVKRTNLQLVGVACLSLASKYEDVYPPEIHQLVSACDKAYTARDIVTMEKFILENLRYQITVSTVHDFLERYQNAGHLSAAAIDLSSLLAESSLLHYELLQYKPSQLASAAVMIARKMDGRHLWSPTLLKYAEYREEEIVPVARALLQAKASEASGHWLKLQAIRRKYGRSKFHRVSTVPLPSPGDL
mmetsp:Transcript_29830/g.60535  ORF Transcript_29830/g.60535 Transcript_29830/m.60535 type:complete len:431 (+) Transcript_29830:139-1431(+)